MVKAAAPKKTSGDLVIEAITKLSEAAPRKAVSRQAIQKYIGTQVTVTDAYRKIINNSLSKAVAAKRISSSTGSSFKLVKTAPKPTKKVTKKDTEKAITPKKAAAAKKTTEKKLSIKPAKKAAATKKVAEKKAAAPKKVAEKKAAAPKKVAEKKAAAPKKVAEKKAAAPKKVAEKKAAAPKKVAEKKTAKK